MAYISRSSHNAKCMEGMTSFFSICILIEDVKPMLSYPFLYCNHIVTPCAPQFKNLSSEIPKLPIKYSKSKYGYF